MLPSSLAGPVVAAAALGATHAVEPDHVAGISSLTSRYGSSRASALAGVCFSLGHVALVVVWLAVAYAVFGRTSFDPALAAAGKVGAGLLLAALGLTMAVAGVRTLVHRHDESAGAGDRGDADGHRTAESHRDGVHHDGDGHRRPNGHDGLHVHLPLPGVGVDHDHDDVPSVRRFLRTGAVGALFTLSPPLSMIAFASGVMPDHGGGGMALIVLAYAASITVAMGAVGALVGSVFATTRLRDGRLHGGAQVTGAVLVCVVAAHLLWTAVPAVA
jgi:ABC-type nickel/cobalt efflux system permease component RcnA